MPFDSEGQPAALLRRQATAEHQRARLIAATIELAGQRGWEQMTLLDVVSRAGVSKRTVYDFYADKQECFLAAASEVTARVAELTLSAYRSSTDVRSGIADAIHSLMDLCAAEPLTARVYLVETPSAGHAGAELWRNHMETMTDRAMCAFGELRDDLPAFSGSIAVGGVYTVAQARVAAGQADRLPELAPEMTAALWKTLGIEGGMDT